MASKSIDFNRRQLLTGIAATTAGLMGNKSATAATLAPSQVFSTNGGADLWQSVREQFHFSAQPPLNAANLCPAFSDVLDAHHTFAAKVSADVGFLNRRDFVRNELKQTRRACAQLLGVQRIDDLALVRNTSEANAVVVSGLDLAPDDEVLLWQENHATNYRSWHYRHQRRPFRVRTLSLEATETTEADVVAQFRAALNEKTRVVSFSHISNITGTRLPAEAICRMVHAYNPDIFVHVDGAQSWGSMPVDLTAMDCDSYSSSAHKWLCGPRGVGILYVRKAWSRRLHPLILGYDFEFNYPEATLPDDARRFESIGQRDTAACAALGVAVRKHLEIGSEHIQKRVSELTERTRQAFENAGIPVHAPIGREHTHGVVVAELGSAYKSYGAFLALHNAGIASAFVHGNTVHCTPQGVPEHTESPVLLRLCPHIYNTAEDIDVAVQIAARVHRSNFEIIREVIRFL